MIDTHSQLARAEASLAAGRHAEGLVAVRAVLEHEPQNLDALLLLERLHVAEGRRDLALDAARRAVTVAPDNTDVRVHLASALSLSGAHAEAIPHFDRLARNAVANAQTLVFHGASLRGVLRFDESIAVFKRACAAFPDNAAIACQLASTMNYAPGVPAQDIFEAHRRVGEVLARECSPRPAWRVTPDPGRPLRVGLLSADLRTHSVAFFIEPLLEHADTARTAYMCFSTSATSDAVSERLRSRAAAWHDLAGRADATIAHKILTERIDVLVDLGGLSSTLSGARVMNLRCAPVQATYLGYPNTTGVRAIDARLVDSITDPPGAEAFAVESLVRLDPCFLCFRPPERAPAPVRAPGDAVVFGSFNNVLKLNDAVIGLWSSLVSSVPGARLFIKDSGTSLNDPGVRAMLASKFTAAGLASERLEIVGYIPDLANHLDLYSRIDVALDPFPYNGTTTSCDALWMGVPVVTLRGTVHAARVGASLLSAVGLNEFIAATPEEYRSIASGLAADRARREALRSSLRARMAGSALCDGPAFARRFEAALRGLWVRWCGERAGAAATGAPR